ncbi:MAG: hypothetical protein P8M80_12355 [Pirellulaceae bacterium]|jgi:hypothetical protein|nr:hypothetical protein [Mariniblastus sp.]MDG2470065.1 hypothetical protein [Pirellulaceae bacterium]
MHQIECDPKKLSRGRFTSGSGRWDDRMDTDCHRKKGSFFKMVIPAELSNGWGFAGHPSEWSANL